jgi:hypothetical protein
MALVKLGIVATDVRNSVGGTVFSRNAGGAYTRARVAPINRNTPKQTAVRASFAANSKLWSGTMTADERAAWTLFAAANPSVNVLGASIILSGLAMANRLNQVLAQIGVPPILTPPSDLSVPTLATVTGGDAAPGGPVELDTAAQAVVAGAKYYIFATGNLAPGRKPPTSAFRFMGAYAAVAAAVAVDFSGAWVASYGLPTLGSTIGILAATVNVESGAVTPGLMFYVTVAV